MNKIYVCPSDNLQYILDNITEPTTIYMKKGVYTQKLIIRAKNVKLVGEDRETTVITHGDYAKKRHADGGEYNTFRTFTVCVTGENTVIQDLTVENSAGSPEVNGQCVALSVNANNFRGINLRLTSTQDTLFSSPFPDDLVVRYSGLTPDPAYYDGFIPREQLYAEGVHRQIFINCVIEGTIDFVFGGAEAYFLGCEFISLNEKRGTGYVAAPCHPLAADTGFVFYSCDFESGGAEDGSVFLARPWRDFGKCEFLNCRLGKHINGALFDKWNDTYRDKTARFYYGELSSAAQIEPVKWGKEISGERAKLLKQKIESIIERGIDAKD